MPPKILNAKKAVKKTTEKKVKKIVEKKIPNSVKVEDPVQAPVPGSGIPTNKISARLLYREYLIYLS